MNNAIVALSYLGRGRGRGGGGTPLYKPYRYVAPQRVGLFSPFDLITGVGRGGYTLPILVWNRNSQEYPTPGNR